MSSETEKTVIGHAAGWLASQPFTNVVLVCILGYLGWCSHFAITQAIPTHLKQIQTGYTEVVEECNKKHSEIVRTYDRWIEIIQRQNVHGDKSTATSVAQPDTP